MERKDVTIPHDLKGVISGALLVYEKFVHESNWSRVEKVAALVDIQSVRNLFAGRSRWDEGEENNDNDD